MAVAVEQPAPFVIIPRTIAAPVKQPIRKPWLFRRNALNGSGVFQDGVSRNLPLIFDLDRLVPQPN
ncbi:MAG: hypothetical protein ACWGQW_04375 [bacterium]